MSERIDALARDYTRTELIEALKQQAALQEVPPKSKPVFEPIDIDGCPDIRLEELGISQRTFNLLRRNALYRLLYILECSEAELLASRGMGPKCLAEIRNMLQEYGYQLHPIGRLDDAKRLVNWMRKKHGVELRYASNSSYRHFYQAAVSALRPKGVIGPELLLSREGFTPPIGW